VIPKPGHIQAQPAVEGKGKRARAAGLSHNVVQPLQPLGDDVTKGLLIGIVLDGAGVDAKRQQTIPRIKAVDGHLNTSLWAPFYLAKVVVDHCRQLFSGLFSFALAGSGRPWLSGDSSMGSSSVFIFPAPWTVALQLAVRPRSKQCGGRLPRPLHRVSITSNRDLDFQSSAANRRCTTQHLASDFRQAKA
jgi:hypothetical protein